MADSTLAAIRTKVRRLTRSPSTSQITTANVDEYINTFIQYDIPEHLRLFSLRKTFSFFCSPFVDTYKTNTADTTDQFFNFKNIYTSVHDPVYIAGYKALYSQSRDEFFNIYPLTNSIINIATGDGGTTTYTGTLSNIPVLPNNITFASVDTTNGGLVQIDVPVVDGNGNPTQNGNLYAPNAVPAVPPTVIDANNTINYVTGIYTVTFAVAPASAQDVTVQTIPYQASRPEAILFYDNTFTLRPVPDKPYRITMEVYRRPTEVLNSGDSPELEQWWQYIAYGAAKKIFEDRSDLDSVAQIMPEFKQQERLVLRKTIVQQTNERTATIYTEQTSLEANPYGYGNFF